MKHIKNCSSLQVVILIFITLFLSGCKIDLYSSLTEGEGNEMLAILLDGGIETEKLQDKDKNVTLKVKSKEVSRAIRLLQSYGYPRERFSSVGDIFPKEGLISSPTEERARYTYSMSQELSATLSMIDGVITARVHVLPQETDSLTEITYPSSSSVFIKYTPELDLAGFIPKVKTLVANSIEGLSLDKIAVSLFPATRINQVGSTVQDDIKRKNENKSNSEKKILIFGFFLIIILGIAAAVYFIWASKNGRLPRSLFSKKSQNVIDDDFSEEMEINIDNE